MLRMFGGMQTSGLVRSFAGSVPYPHLLANACLGIKAQVHTGLGRQRIHVLHWPHSTCSGTEATFMAPSPFCRAAVPQHPAHPSRVYALLQPSNRHAPAFCLPDTVKSGLRPMAIRYCESWSCVKSSCLRT